MRIRRICFVVAASLFCLVAAATTVYAGSKITYNGQLWTYTDIGYVGVGYFLVDGKIAFCCEHSNSSPETGTDTVKSVVADAKMRKILFYGWGGPGQWDGFDITKLKGFDSNMSAGIIITSLMLSEVHTTAHPVGTYDCVDGMEEFRKFVNSNPEPDLSLSFSKQKLTSYYSKDLDCERTENIKVQGIGYGTISLTIPDDYYLHLNSSNKNLHGTVSLKSGDSFYLRTKSNTSPKKSIDIKGKNAALSPVIFVTADSSVQDLTRLDVVEESAATSKLHVDWIGKVGIRITKLDSDTGDKLNGAVFEISGADDRLYSLTEPIKARIEKNGEIKLDGVLELGRNYQIREISAPYSYDLIESDSIQFVLPLGKTKTEEIVFENTKQLCYLEIKKSGVSIEEGSDDIIEKTALEGVSFEISAAQDVPDWGGDTILYRSGDIIETVITDEKGMANSRALPRGRYAVLETHTCDGYIMDSELRTFELRPDSDKQEMHYMVPLQNFKYERRLETTPVIEIPDEPDKPTPSPEPAISVKVEDPVETGDIYESRLKMFTLGLAISLIMSLVLTVSNRYGKVKYHCKH